MQSPRGCPHVVGMERGYILAKNVFRPPLSKYSGSASGVHSCLEFPNFKMCFIVEGIHLLIAVN